jgi:hypothetical protein
MKPYMLFKLIICRFLTLLRIIYEWIAQDEPFIGLFSWGASLRLWWREGYRKIRIGNITGLSSVGHVADIWKHNIIGGNGLTISFGDLNITLMWHMLVVSAF